MARRRSRYFGVKVRSTLPPLTRKYGQGSAKRRVVFSGGPWNNKHGWLAETITDTGLLRLGERKGNYKYSGVVRNYGKHGKGPSYYEYAWHPAPYEEPQTLHDVLAI